MGWFSSEVAAGIAGGAIAILGQLIVHWAQQRDQRSLDKSREATLRHMLEPVNHPSDVTDGWRKMETLQRVIGADRETTARLLVNIGARGNEKTNDVWALIQHKPLPTKTGDI